MILLPLVEELPPVPREFRAAWVATVDNIDWPSKRGLPAAIQKAELIRILDRAVTLKLNAIVLQVRPAADALYRSKLEPWSEYLTGRQGKDPGYDPLEFAVKEAHRRGLELHAWFNPYRAKHPSAKGNLAKNHIAKTNPGVVKSYAKQLWMDPGEPIVQKRTLDVFVDVVRRYDIDGVHIDDYFYPYPEKGQPFPDAGSYARYGGGLSLDDWRRQNVDTFVQNAYQAIHRVKPWVQFGISPFGIYRPGYPASISAGVDQYAQLYADVRLWLREGWLDYLAPQLYWPIDQRAQSFPVLLQYWRSENVKGRHIWPGLYTSRTIPGDSSKPYRPQEVVRQVLLARKDTQDAGTIHFSMKALSLNSAGVADMLRGQAYQNDALPPASPWLSSTPPPPPSELKCETSAEPGGADRLTWAAAEGAETPFRQVLWTRYRGHWDIRVLPGTVREWPTYGSKVAGDLEVAALASADRNGNLSEAIYFPAPVARLSGKIVRR